MNKRKGISLIVLVITILVMLILSGVVIVSLSKNNPVEKAKEATFKENAKTYKDSLAMYITNNFAENTNMHKEEINASLLEDMQKYITEFAKKHVGVYEIESGELVYVGKKEEERKWMQEIGVRVVVDRLPAPSMDPAMSKIKFVDGKEVAVKEGDNSWYNYNARILPNVKLHGESYYVWIPRYAYRLVYYANAKDLEEAKTYPKGDPRIEEKAIGFSDIRGLVNKEGVLDGTFKKRYILFDGEFLGEGENAFKYIQDGRYNYDVTKEKGEKNPRGLVVHPAFSKWRRNNATYQEGNFGEVKEISGFWMAKCEYTNQLRSMPGVAPETYISINDLNNKINTRETVLNNAKFLTMNQTTTKWGASIYLTQIYGVEIKKNDQFLTASADNFAVNVAQSNTGNITGVYDLHGCRWEYLNAYIANGNAKMQEHASFLTTNKNSRVVDVYAVGVDDDNSNLNANSTRYGDSFYETVYFDVYFYNNAGRYCAIPYGENPVFCNGGADYNTVDTDYRSVHRDYGQPYGGTSYRGIIVEK